MSKLVEVVSDTAHVHTADKVNIGPGGVTEKEELGAPLPAGTGVTLTTGHN